MIIIGLTGGICSGKSTISNMFASHGKAKIYNILLLGTKLSVDFIYISHLRCFRIRCRQTRPRGL